MLLFRSQVFGQEAQDGAVDAELRELDQRDAELFAEHSIQVLSGDEPEVVEDFAQMTRIRALNLQRAVQLVLGDEPELEEPRAELECRDGALASQRGAQLLTGAHPLDRCGIRRVARHECGIAYGGGVVRSHRAPFARALCG